MSFDGASAFHVADRLFLVVPKENYIIKQPVFYAAALEDRIAISSLAVMGMKPVCPNLTVREYQTDHVCASHSPIERS